VGQRIRRPLTGKGVVISLVAITEKSEMGSKSEGTLVYILSRS